MALTLRLDDKLMRILFYREFKKMPPHSEVYMCFSSICKMFQLSFYKLTKSLLDF